MWGGTLTLQHMKWNLGSVEEQGRGLTIGWTRALYPPRSHTRIVCDTREDVTLLLPTHAYGIVLLINAHLLPKMPHRMRHTVVRAWATVRTTKRPRCSIAQGECIMHRRGLVPWPQPSGLLGRVFGKTWQTLSKI